MASVQKSREEHARSAAQKAADELTASRRDHAHDHEAAAAPVSPRGGGGILSGVQEGARSVMGAVRSTFSGGCGGARHDETSATDAAADRATAAMESAREYAADKTEGARRALAGDAAGRKGETDDSAWQQGQDVRRRAAEKAQEERRRVSTHEPSEEEKGRAATENIYGKVTGAMGAFGEKMVMPTDVMERKRAEAAGVKGGEAAAPTAGTGDDDEPDEDVMLRVKAADHMTGQTFNDVGPMGEEGTGMPRRR